MRLIPFGLAALLLGSCATAKPPLDVERLPRVNEPREGLTGIVPGVAARTLRAVEDDPAVAVELREMMFVATAEAVTLPGAALIELRFGSGTLRTGDGAVRPLPQGATATVAEGTSFRIVPSDDLPVIASVLVVRTKR